MKNKEELRQTILQNVKEYYKLSFQSDQAFEEGDFIRYGGRVFDEEELCLLTESVLDFWLTNGRFNDRFEKELAEYLGVRYCYTVNSGSSANLLAFMALTSPLLKDRRITPGDEVITVAASFPTTVAPVVQYGAVPVFVDVSFPTLNIDVSMLEGALSGKTKAVMLAHTLGNAFDLKAVKEFCDEHRLWLIEDNCDSLGTEYERGGTFYKTGSLGDIGTSSFYPPHHMTMGEGGAVYTNDPLLSKILLSMRDWGRDCVCPSGVDNKCKQRFHGEYGLLPKGYDHKYVYSHFGYNLKITDMQAAVGCAQLKKLPEFIKARRANFAYLNEKLSDLSEFFILPKAEKDAHPSWFGFTITLRDNLPFTRESIVQYLESKNIQTRLVFAGNLIKQPCFDEMRQSGKGYRVAGSLKNTDKIMKDTFWIGVYPGMTKEKLDFMSKVIHEFVSGL